MADSRSGSFIERLRGQLGTVRVRATLGAAAVVGLVLLLAALVFVLLLRRALTEDVRRAAVFRAEAVGDVIAADPSALLSVGDEEDEFAQVVDVNGVVVASSENVQGMMPLATLEPGESVTVDVPFEDGGFLVAAVESGPNTILVGRTLENVTESTKESVALLIAGLPLLLIAVAGVAYRVVGRALAPVEAIRDEVAAISTSDLDRRVTEPATRDEIARLAATMNEMLERLDRGHKRQMRFVSDASHELRSPVASIRQHAEVALAHPDRTSVGELAQTVLDEDLRVQRLVEDLLVLARIDEGAARVLDPVDLDDLVLEAVERGRMRRDIEVDARSVSGGRVQGDRRQLARLVGNIIENAVRHARSRVTVTLGESEDIVVLSVDDDGPGVPEEDRERVFERFVRRDEARDRDSGGAGLGLAIVAEVARAHGGTAGISEAPTAGARLEVRLPRSQA